uniref:SH3 domain-containing protein n=1 Tax=Rhabditophanes sp. KR3021 TaxID=114890 RepID=A0AC35TJG0_9BILA
MSGREDSICCIAVDTFLQKAPAGSPVQFLNFYTGERLRRVSGNGEWSYGYLDENPKINGIFPTIFVLEATEDFDVIPSISDQSTSTNSTAEGDESHELLREITSTVRDWWSNFRGNYHKISDYTKYDNVFKLMDSLMLLRKKIMSRSVPDEEMKDIRSHIHKKIEIGNHYMALDMKTRDETGKLLKANTLSIIETYKHHVATYDKIIGETNVPSKFIPSQIVGNFGLFFQFHSTTLSVSCDVEIKMSLYDAVREEFFTDSFVFFWSHRTGTFNDRFCQVMFVELGDVCKERNKIFVLLQVSKNGLLENKVPTKKDGNPEVWARQPYATGMIDVYDILGKSVEFEKTDLSFDLEKIWSFDLSSKQDKPSKNERYDGKILFMSAVKVYKGHLNEIKEQAFKLFSLNPTPIIHPIKHKEFIWEEAINEFFLTLISGDFNGYKSTDKSIEIRMQVMDAQGNTIMNSVENMTPEGIKGKSTYESNVVVGNDKPRWNELIKLNIKDRYQDNIHIRFLFFNRKMNDKAKTDKGPFALAFLPLIRNANLIIEGKQDLVIYKVDMAKFNERDMSYLSLPSFKINGKALSKSSNNYLSLAEKNSFQINLKINSTNLTHNPLILNILQWKMNKLDTKKNLTEIINSEHIISDGEILYMMPYICDILFEIWDDNEVAKDLQRLVFKTLIHVLRATHDTSEIKGFKEFFENYMANFAFTTVYTKVIQEMLFFLRNSETFYDEVNSIFQSFGILMAFIVASKNACDLLMDTDSVDFPALIHEILTTIIDSIMLNSNRKNPLHQNMAVVHFAECVNHLTERGMFDVNALSIYVITFIDTFNTNVLQKEKLNFIQKIVESQLFKNDQSRQAILNRFLDEIVDYLDLEFDDSGDNEMTLDFIKQACPILCNIVEYLFPFSSVTDLTKPGTREDFMAIAFKVLRPLNRVIVHLIGTKANEKCLRDCVTTLYSILDIFSAQTFLIYVEEHECAMDTIDMINELGNLLSELISTKCYPVEWAQMGAIQRNVTAKIFLFIKQILTHYFNREDALSHEMYKSFFEHLVVLCVEGSRTWNVMDDNEREIIRIVAIGIRSLWFEMGNNKIENDKKQSFCPDIIKSFLKVTFIEDSVIREAMACIFVDMLISNYLLKDKKESLERVESELLRQLDEMIEFIPDSETFRQEFIKNLHKFGSNDYNFYKFGGQMFFEKLDSMLILVLQYKTIANSSDCVENCMIEIIKLIRFLNSIKQYDLYVRYIYKLYDMNMSCNNKVEAALTLLKHAELLNWSDELLPETLASNNLNRNSNTHLQLKVLLYSEIADLLSFDLWERAIEILKELTPVYESILFDYKSLSIHHNRLSDLYNKINAPARMENSYYLVRFYGKGFATHLNNCSFIFRDIQKRGDFQSKLQNSYGPFTIINTMEKMDDLLVSNGKHVQIIPVKAIPTSRKILDNDKIHHNIKWYYRFNDVHKFEYCKGEERLNTKWTTLESSDFTKMWVIKYVVETYDQLPNLIAFSKVKVNHMPVASSPLDEAILRIERVVQPFVMGGVKNYMVFCTQACFEICDEEERKKTDELKYLLKRLIVILEYSLYVHSGRTKQVEIVFHQSLVESYYELRGEIKNKFGAITETMIPSDATLTMQPTVVERHPSTVTSFIGFGGSMTMKAYNTRIKSSLQKYSPARTSKTNLLHDESVEHPANITCNSSDISSNDLNNSNHLNNSTSSGYKKHSQSNDVRLRKNSSLMSIKCENPILPDRRTDLHSHEKLSEEGKWVSPSTTTDKPCLLTDF